jgi:AcrR family transcriptional regulator
MSSSDNRTQEADEPIRPLYRRLPHGPCKLSPEEVKRNQRARLLGAMTEAIGKHGYERVTVQEVIGLAGVSRRAYYELFANKQQCFLATFDRLDESLLASVQAACAASPGDVEDRLRASLGALADRTAAEAKGTRMLMLEGPVAGEQGLRHHHQATARFERILIEALKRRPQAPGVPRPLIRAIVGGLHGAFSDCLRDGALQELDDVVEHLVSWTLACAAPPPPLPRRLPQAVARDGAGLPVPAGSGPRASAPSVEGCECDERARLLEQVLLLAAAIPFDEVTAVLIADEAGVPIESFTGLFTDKQDCFCAAIDAFAGELETLVSDSGPHAGDWPRQLRHKIGELTWHLAAHPQFTRAIVIEALWAGPLARQRSLAVAPKLAELLTAGAPETPHAGIVTPLVAGAIWHTIRCYTLADQIRALPLIADQLTYILLAPLMGADNAAAALAQAA